MRSIFLSILIIILLATVSCAGLGAQSEMTPEEILVAIEEIQTEVEAVQADIVTMKAEVETMKADTENAATRAEEAAGKAELSAYEAEAVKYALIEKIPEIPAEHPVMSPIQPKELSNVVISAEIMEEGYTSLNRCLTVLFLLELQSTDGLSYVQTKPNDHLTQKDKIAFADLAKEGNVYLDVIVNEKNLWHQEQLNNSGMNWACAFISHEVPEDATEITFNITYTNSGQTYTESITLPINPEGWKNC